MFIGWIYLREPWLGGKPPFIDFRGNQSKFVLVSTSLLFSWWVLVGAQCHSWRLNPLRGITALMLVDLCYPTDYFLGSRIIASPSQTVSPGSLYFFLWCSEHRIPWVRIRYPANMCRNVTRHCELHGLLGQKGFAWKCGTQNFNRLLNDLCTTMMTIFGKTLGSQKPLLSLPWPVTAAWMPVGEQNVHWHCCELPSHAHVLGAAAAKRPAPGLNHTFVYNSI